MAAKNRFLLPAMAAAVIFILFWSPALGVPFWQDDYEFLLSAKQAHLEHKPWSTPFFCNLSHHVDWRPLSTGVYWRLLEEGFQGDVRVAHASNIALLLLASIAVGSLAGAFLRVRFPEGDAARGGLAAAFFYGIHGSHLLNVAWVTQAQDSLVVLFSALTLQFWLLAATRGGWRANLAAAAAVLGTMLALSSKETAVILPALELALSLWIWPRHKPTLRICLLGLACLVVTGLWWIARQRLTVPPPPVYALSLGLNVLRNTSSLLLFALNLPRESLRFTLAEHSIPAALWGVACVAIQLGACLLLLRGAQTKIVRRDAVFLAAIALVGLAPYALLGWNCYEYYASMALVAYALLAGLAAQRPRLLLAAAALVLLSSALATGGNYWLPYPAVIARARWGQRQLATVKSLREGRAGALRGRIYVKVEDPHKFLAFGQAGLAYTLGLPLEDIVVLDPAVAAGQMPRGTLVSPPRGDVYLTD
jgi:hypothetical protein